MLRALQDLPRRGQDITAPYSRPAPVGGLNTRDPLNEMAPTDAILLDNWLPKTQSVDMRPGALNWATDNVEGLASDEDVETLAVYEPASGTRKLFATSPNAVYNITAGGSASLADISSLTNGRWSWTNFSNSGGTYLLMVNGADGLRSYNGSTWTNTATVNAGAKQTSDFIAISVFKFRVFMIQKDSLQFWFNASAGAFTGTYTEFETRQLFKRGGKLIAMDSWTFDGGAGPDDRFVLITSEGEIAVFEGTNPGDAAAWNLIGVYFIGKPLGRRCLIKYGGDLLALTERGLFPLTKALNAGDQAEGTALTNKIDSSFNDAAVTAASNFGWEVQIFPLQTLGIVNVPTSPTVQYVWNLLTGAWSRITGWSAKCFVVFNNTLYMGMTGKVAKALVGATDFGGSIEAQLKTAFDYFGTPGDSKTIPLIRPTFQSDGPFGYFLGVVSDFAQDTPTGLVTIPPFTAATWDSSLWDAATWGSDDLMTRQWQSVACWDGFAHSTYLKVSSASVRPKLRAFDYKVLRGGGL